jgi:6-phosphogluconolactonase
MLRNRATRGVQIFPDKDALDKAAAAFFATRCAESIGATGRFTVALAGGSTPQGLYRLLGSEGFRTRIPWNRVHLFWGDERCVPPSSRKSNYRMAAESLLAHVPVPPGNIHRMQGELPPCEGAARYEETLRTFFTGPGLPVFNLILLGLGPDGHVASLFPYSEGLQERERLVVPNYSWAEANPRLTLTLPVINRAETILFLVAGEEKRSVVSRVLRRESSPARLPARAVCPVMGDLLWYLDKTAAGEIAAR